MLSNYRVLDLTDERGIFCGYLLAHLGAEVVAIEPPGGSSTRRKAPFKDKAGLWWEAYARGKRSLELDLATETGQHDFEALVKEVDFVIESFSPAERADLALDYSSLSLINPTLILVSITAFGQTGPKADWPATDLTVWAASGAQALAGDADRAPVRTSVPQTYMHAAADAAGAALIALQARHKTGFGQHVDISAQCSSAQAALSAFLGPANNSEVIIEREAGGLAGAFPIQMTWPCRNGYVAITFLFGPAFTEPNKRLLRWLAEDGYCSKQTAEEDWGIKIAAMIATGESPESYFELCKQIQAFTLTRSKEALFEEGLARGIYIAPTLDVENLLKERHFHSRDYWQKLNMVAAEARVPGAFAKMPKSPLKRLGVAPQLNDFQSFASVLGSKIEPTGSSERPLAGLKVLDFMWVIAGPIFTRLLTDYGATVVKVESSVRLDPVRAAPPFVNDEQLVSHGTCFSNFNAGKLGVTIDPSNPVGREVILDLVKWADVVTESFSPKAMRAWGLDYDTLRSINPDLIMLSSCLMGQTGERSMIPGYGNMAAAITGFYELTGWQDRSPAGPYLAYTDGVAPRFMLASLMAALEHRRNTGEGQHIDISQAEAAIHLLAPAILDYELNEHVWPRMGNRDLECCPHGVFQVSGDDRWVALVCQSDKDWQALCELGGFDDLREDPSLKTAPKRKLREDDLEMRISDWTGAQDEDDLVASLIAAGIAAHVVQKARDCMDDPQLKHRSHFITTTHSTVGDVVLENSRFRLSKTPAVIERAGPDMGEHNVEVLTEILGYDMDKVADIFASLTME